MKHLLISLFVAVLGGSLAVARGAGARRNAAGQLQELSHAAAVVAADRADSAIKHHEVRIAMAGAM